MTDHRRGASSAFWHELNMALRKPWRITHTHTNTKFPKKYLFKAKIKSIAFFVLFDIFCFKKKKRSSNLQECKECLFCTFMFPPGFPCWVFFGLSPEPIWDTVNYRRPDFPYVSLDSGYWISTGKFPLCIKGFTKKASIPPRPPGFIFREWNWKYYCENQCGKWLQGGAVLKCNHVRSVIHNGIICIRACWLDETTETLHRGKRMCRSKPGVCVGS